MMLFLLSLMGIPPLVEFAAKLYIVEALVSAGSIGLAVLVMLNSVVSGYYYLRVNPKTVSEDLRLRAPSGRQHR
jgi:NADH-quinone oxidoreductase subunit N